MYIQYLTRLRVRLPRSGFSFADFSSIIYRPFKLRVIDTFVWWLFKSILEGKDFRSNSRENCHLSISIRLSTRLLSSKETVTAADLVERPLQVRKRGRASKGASDVAGTALEGD